MDSAPLEKATHMKASLRSIVSHVDPNIDKHFWRLQRHRDVQKRRSSFLSEGRALRRKSTEGLNVRVLVVLPVSTHHPKFRIAGIDYFFEIQQSLKESLGEANVSLMEIAPDEPSESWQNRVLAELRNQEITHLISQVETDPINEGSWTWDLMADSLQRYWDGTWIGVMWDAAYPWLTERARRLSRLSQNLILADFGEPISDLIRTRRPHVGPVTMPLSAATIQVLQEEARSVEKQFDVSFIGALYDNRLPILQAIEETGLRLSVNPHRPDTPTNYDQSRANQPNYLAYIRALAASETTLNFSMANAGTMQQYKIRIVEAALSGCLPLTDDAGLTQQFFSHEDFGHFASPKDLPPLLDQILGDKERLRERQASAQLRALQLAQGDFWGRINDAAIMRRLRPLDDRRTP